MTTTLADYWRVYSTAKLTGDPDVREELLPLLECVFYAGVIGALRCLDECDQDIWPARIEEIDEEVRRRVAEFERVMEVRL